MGVPLEDALERARAHARALPVVDPVQHRRRLGRGAERGAVLGRATARSRTWSSRSNASRATASVVELRRRRRARPDLVPLVVGSEGTLAVVTSAKLRLHPAPTSRGFASVVASRRREHGWDAMRGSLPVGSPPGGRAPLRSVRRDAGASRRRQVGSAKRETTGGSARSRSFGGAALRTILARPGALERAARLAPAAARSSAARCSSSSSRGSDDERRARRRRRARRTSRVDEGAPGKARPARRRWLLHRYSGELPAGAGLRERARSSTRWRSLRRGRARRALRRRARARSASTCS